MHNSSEDAQAGNIAIGAIALLNSAVLTDFGHYEMSPISEADAATLVGQRGFVSAVGHFASAGLFSKLLDVHCPVNRVRHAQKVGEEALILRIGTRLPEGCILQSVSDIEQAGYSLALLRRLS
jgi:hypothetical protein